ncbi:hypothetical protein F2Q69_00012761 [Brassica cretica]|uniref:Uncharacterized protein n=1 Tax=Brassica cretica TaxID=69181 RepID=A0A8S9R3B4_BRACR|nr:hypothetical protein F2Q69_00012761 [Brassica cretica]
MFKVVDLHFFTLSHSVIPTFSNFRSHQRFYRATHDSVIHGFTPVGHANHYMPSLKADSIVKVDRFELQARLQSGKFKWNDIPTTETASVMDSSLPRIALTMVSGKKKILLLKKDRDNPVNSLFQAEQQMEANFSGSSSTSRQNQKINVGGRLIKEILQRSETA